MDFFGVLTMVGGLALFLYGMHVMGEGLEKLAGSQLEHILEKLTANKFKAIAFGALVTAVIQSSSATSVMVVGLVNSGLMRLSQAVGVIMGANIGTTATSWILSLAGIKGNNFFIELIKPSSFSPVLAVVGVVFILFFNSKKKKDLGTIFIGFAVLMFGMETMAKAVEPLKDVPSFTHLFVAFTNPILGMLVGAVLTAIIQSSSASVGILQALCMTGGVSYAAAIPIIMGQNIGTCVTAMISSVGAKTNAKRAALVHLYFNIIGTVIFMAIFYTLEAFVHFHFMDMPANPFGIAVVHTCFNVVATVVLSIFSSGLEKLAIISVKETQEEAVDKEEFVSLDPRFLETPAFAIDQAKVVTGKMAQVTKKGLNKAFDLINEYNSSRAERVIDLEELVDKYEDHIGSFLLKANSSNLSENASRELTLLLRSLVDWERISDHSINIKESAEELYDKKQNFSDIAVKEMDIYISAIKDIVSKTVNIFQSEDISKAKDIEPFEEVIDDLSKELKARHVKRLRKGECSIDLGFVWNDIITNCERISDHCSNIAVTIIEINNNVYDLHDYLTHVKEDESIDFEKRYAYYSKKYKLPPFKSEQQSVS